MTACNEKSQKFQVPLPTEKQISEMKADTAARALVSMPQIKTAFNATIKKLENKTLDSVAIRYNCNQERSGTITYYSESGKLAAIKHAYNEYDHFEATDQYFVQDSVVYFAFYKHLNWSFESGAAIEGATKDDIIESRYYLIGNKFVECLEKKYTIYSTSRDKTNPDQIANRTIDCKAEGPLLATFKKLVAFSDRSNGDCFDK